ncbi:hypothetical protein M514_28459 [Trichuris suis]|uniref:DDE-1 domain-containing protein n=1 Tax=Trichuris suis TaxID=68888 RepID=A0A085MQ66_9BILA|nr:hypothetical protein M514_28459 [Trichuris suis]
MEHHDICEVPIVSSASVQRNKKKRKVTTLEAKLNVVALREDGRPVMDIAREEYLPEQIFNVDESSMFWKRMLERTYIQQQFNAMLGHKANKESVTQLFGGNVAGLKLKPFLISTQRILYL